MRTAYPIGVKAYRVLRLDEIGVELRPPRLGPAAGGESPL
jgi:hypothetical protein